MSEPYIAQIMVFAFNFAPQNWAFCNGALLPIAQNQALFSIVGTTYGGDGRTNFALPDIRDGGVMGVGQGPNLSNYVLGQKSGFAEVALTPAQIATHTHIANAIGTPLPANLVATPQTNYWIGSRDAGASVDLLFSVSSGGQAFAPQVVSVSGGSLPHQNEQPYVGMNYCIALYGVFPTPN